MAPLHARGFTLVEVSVVLCVTGVLAAVALPSYRQHGLRMARLDAVQALTRLQAAQEQHRALHGLYASEMAALRGVTPTSPQQRYAVALQPTGPDSYRATASAQGLQVDDRDCRALTLEVAQGFAQAGPTAQCWNR
ncbi:MAG: type IV pilin protein [Rubrivivax sp.]|nr:type IV pilin protein [Rubrivivax sp.]